MNLTKDFVYKKKENSEKYIKADQTVCVGLTHPAVVNAVKNGRSWAYLAIETTAADFYISCAELKKCVVARSTDFHGRFYVIPVSACAIVYRKGYDAFTFYSSER